MVKWNIRLGMLYNSIPVKYHTNMFYIVKMKTIGAFFLEGHFTFRMNMLWIPTPLFLFIHLRVNVCMCFIRVVHGMSGVTFSNTNTVCPVHTSVKRQ